MKTALLLHPDRLLAGALRQLVQQTLPGTHVLLQTSTAAPLPALARLRIDLLVAALDPMLGDVPGLIDACSSHPTGCPRVLVLGSPGDDRALTTLRALSIGGMFDPIHDEPGKFSVAVQSVAAGGNYWSPSLLRRLASHDTNAGSLANTLTIRQQIVLTVLGDGSDDHTAAHELGLRPSSVSTIRRQLHRKLGVQHRGELMRVAAQHGFVRFTSAGVVRPGFTLLTAAFHERKTRRALRRAA